MKRCRKCKRNKVFSHFHRNRRERDGFQACCKECVKEYQQSRRAELRAYMKHYRVGYYKRNTEKMKAQSRQAMLKRNYNMTIDEYDALLASQDGKCAICGTTDDRFVVDHCHKTGNVRGILCNSCNRGLGYFRDNAEVLTNAAAYMNTH